MYKYEESRKTLESLYMIIPKIIRMDDSFLRNRFANQYLADARTLRIGNIISFVAPVELSESIRSVKPIIAEEAINFCLELPELSNYA